jgi:hypothetical protein
MPTSSSVYVRTADGSPTVISSRPGAFGASACKRHRVVDIKSALDAGLFPRGVDAVALDRHAGDMLADDSFERAARKRLGKSHATDKRVADARLTNEAHRLRVAQLTDIIEPSMTPTSQRTIAGRAVQILTRAPFDIVIFELAQDLDLHTDLVLDAGISIARFGEIRIYRGAALVPTAPSFVLHATKATGNVLAVTSGQAHEFGVNNVDINDYFIQN